MAKDPQGVDTYHAKYTANEGQGMSASDQATLKSYGDAWNAANAEYQKAVAEGRDGSQYKAQMDQAHKDAEALRGQYGYRGGEDGSEYIPDPAPVPQQQVTRAPSLEAPDFTGLLNSWLETAKKQQELGIDYATNKGVNDLQRAEEDAQEMFQTQQDQVSKDEAKALDNQALYAEARGDRGGIGHAQYGQIQATAMTNRRAVNSARTKLATDTARQIADLRAQGEFQKADALLELTQTYLGQLIDLQKWGAEYALDVAQFETQLQQWQAEFELAVSDVTGMYQGSPTMSAQKANQSILASSGKAALAVGIRPSPEQQAAMGYTDAQIEAELAAYQLAMSAGVSYSGGGDGNPYAPVQGITPVGGTGLTGIFVKMYKNNNIKNESDAYHYLREAGYTAGDAEKYAFDYMTRLEDGSLDRTANDAPKVDLSDIPAWVVADVKERLAGVRNDDDNVISSTLMSHLDLLISKGYITDDQATRLGASFGLPY